MNDHPPLTNQYILERLIANADDSYDLIYIAYDDCLTKDQTAWALQGEYWRIWEDFYEWESDSRWAGYEHVLTASLADLERQLCLAEDYDQSEVEEALRDFKYTEEEESFREYVLDRESSDWFWQLVNQTPSMYIRVALRDEGIWVGCPYEEHSEDAILESAVSQIMESATEYLPDTSEVRAAIREALENQFSSVLTPHLFGTLDPADLLRVDSDTITLTGGILLLEDVWAGSGDVVELPEGVKLKVTIPRAALLMDEAANGWSWEEVCGLVGGLWPVEVEKKQ